MKRTILIFLFTSLAVGQDISAQAGRVSGTVLNADTQEPLRNAKVILQALDVEHRAAGAGQQAQPLMSTQTDVTDSSGRFTIGGVQAGTYVLLAERSGFLRAFYGARKPAGTGSRLRLGRAQELTDVRIEMAPQPIISGRVVDEDGEPMQGAAIHILSSPSTTESARRGNSMMRDLGLVQTDDRGEFRIANASPEPVALMVLPPVTSGTAPGLSSNPPTAYVPIYYPGVFEPDQATMVGAPGTAQTVIEVQMRRVRVFRVRGHVLDANRQIPRSYSADLMSRNGGSLVSISDRTENGGFVFHDVPAGTYLLVVRTDDGAHSNVHAQPLEVGPGADEDLLIAMSPPSVVTGRVTIKDHRSIDVSHINIALRGDLPVAIPLAHPAKDGSFEFSAVPPGVYRITVSGITAGYLAKISFGDIDAISNEITFSPGQQTISITLGADGGTLSGTAKSDDSAHLGFLCLLPKDTKLRGAGLIRTIALDQNGGFMLKNVRPGEYLAVAVEEPSCERWETDEEFQHIADKAKSVDVKADSTESITLDASN